MDRVCDKCSHTKDIKEFALVREGCWRMRCTSCRNEERRNRYEKKLTGYAGLQLDTRNEIATRISNGEKKSIVAREYNLKYQAFSRMVRLGRVMVN